jgi:hypothetical protein
MEVDSASVDILGNEVDGKKNKSYAGIPEAAFVVSKQCVSLLCNVMYGS